MKNRFFKFPQIVLGLLIVGSLAISVAHADWGHRRGGGWDRGHWVHDRHEGRLGWWWVVGSGWHFYPRPHSFVVIQQPAPVVVEQQPAPVVVQQQPAPVVIQQAPTQPTVAPSPVLYYCKATGTQYPETMSCPGGWSTISAETPPQP